MKVPKQESLHFLCLRAFTTSKLSLSTIISVKQQSFAKFIPTYKAKASASWAWRGKRMGQAPAVFILLHRNSYPVFLYSSLHNATVRLSIKRFHLDGMIYFVVFVRYSDPQFLYMCSSFLMASCRNHEQNGNLDSLSEVHNGSERPRFKFDGSFDRTFPSENDSSNTRDSSKSFSDTQLDAFHHRHGLLLLHFVAMMMFAPSMVAWFQRLAIGKSLPWLLDSTLCICIIVNGICNSKPEFNSFFLPIRGFPILKVRLYFLYLIAGYCSYFAGLAMAPYVAVYAMAAVGAISFSLRMLQRRNRDTKQVTYGSRKRH
ncbi:hypothetical protein PIB30_056451 [Stylosanthes scabra]|uniref:Uncharacterized protein n=1 Tax=Stylosanthes scabra TaxID=79078 RepID=A0ABU6WHN1_9FABA|nr:hypothetical protein [Stylosanthes scabra]